VTGKVFLRKDAGGKTVYKGAAYYFCCGDCVKKFKAEPNKYAGAVKGDPSKACPQKGVKGADCKRAIEAGQCPYAKERKK